MERIYPDHIYEPIRRKIAAELVHKELIKLFSSFSKDEWAKILVDVKEWFKGERSDLAPVHDFWNMIDGVMTGSKLKQVVRYFTAENIRWQTKDISVDKIDIMWPVGYLTQLGSLPYRPTKIQAYFKKNPIAFKKNKTLSDKLEARHRSREFYPIILVGSEDNRYQVHDGNRRVLRAIIYNRTTIKAHCGKYVEGKKPRNYWFPTGDLRKLLYYAESANESNNRAQVEAIKKVLKQIFAETEIARINYNLRCANKSDFAKKLIA